MVFVQFSPSIFFKLILFYSLDDIQAQLSKKTYMRPYQVTQKQLGD